MNSYEKAEFKSNEECKNEKNEKMKKRKQNLENLKENIKKGSKYALYKTFNIREEEIKKENRLK